MMQITFFNIFLLPTKVVRTILPSDSLAFLQRLANSSEVMTDAFNIPKL